PDQKDRDEDSVGDACDNCTDIPNAGQADSNDDGTGDACSEAKRPRGDRDDDGIPNYKDDCRSPSPSRSDQDRDHVADRCDNCPKTANAPQRDSDGDGRGDACTKDRYDVGRDHDADGEPTVDDNCPSEKNLSQSDADSDGRGDRCDNCANVPNYHQADADGDDIGDACEKRPSGPICRQKRGKLEPIKPNLLILLDKSGSMRGSHMRDAKQALDTLVTRLASKVRFGLMAFEDTCSPPILLKVDDHGPQKIRSAYRQIRGGGGTGTGGALRTILRKKAYVEKGNPLASARSKAVVLITDGRANGSCGVGVVTMARALHNKHGVDVYTVGFTRGASNPQLNQIASAGGTKKMRSASNARQLAQTFLKLANQIDVCRFKVTSKQSNRAIDKHKIWLTIDGSYIDPAHFTYESSSDVLELDSQACARLKKSSSTPEIHITAGCRTPCDSSSQERCDYRDNDCDRQIDETCKRCPPEVCKDGKDNDCDGETDEGCSRPEPSCKPNREECANGRDEDCDGEADEGCPDCQLLGETCPGDLNCCRGVCRSTDAGEVCKPPRSRPGSASDADAD
ncbi:MAG: VWA domain-containing protein, partial [Bradymonadaceae bacterium]